MWLKQNDTPIRKGVPLQIGVCIVIHLNYTPKSVIFQGVELKMYGFICNFFVILKGTPLQSERTEYYAKDFSNR